MSFYSALGETINILRHPASRVRKTASPTSAQRCFYRVSHWFLPPWESDASAREWMDQRFQPKTRSKVKRRFETRPQERFQWTFFTEPPPVLSWWRSRFPSRAAVWPSSSTGQELILHEAFIGSEYCVPLLSW